MKSRPNHWNEGLFLNIKLLLHWLWVSLTHDHLTHKSWDLCCHIWEFITLWLYCVIEHNKTKCKGLGKCFCSNKSVGKLSKSLRRLTNNNYLALNNSVMWHHLASSLILQLLSRSEQMIKFNGLVSACISFDHFSLSTSPTWWHIFVKAG